MTNLCPNPDVCGSCSWSHIPYPKQLQQKLSDINGSFKIKELPHEVSEIAPSPITEHYRNRMDFVIDWQGAVGLREKGKWWKVIDNHPCFLASTAIESAFFATREWTKTAGLSFYDRKANVGLLRYAVIRSSTLGQVMINVITSAPSSPEESEQIRTALHALAAQSNPTTLIWSINSTITDVSFGDKLETITGPGFIEETIGGYNYRISPNAFFQTNPYGAAILMDTVRQFCGDLADKTLLDLYCGTGFFSIALARDAKRTIGVELNADAIRDAKINNDLNQTTAEFYDSATENYDWRELKPDVVIVDPPRSGMHDKALSDLIAAKPAKIVYISCNYKNLARELVQLQKFYKVSNLRAIDMFPHTPHVELVAELNLKR